MIEQLNWYRVSENYIAYGACTIPPLRHFSDITLAYVSGISQNNSQTYIRLMLIIYKAYIKNILVVSQAFLIQSLGIFQANLYSLTYLSILTSFISITSQEHLFCFCTCLFGDGNSQYWRPNVSTFLAKIRSHEILKKIHQTHFQSEHQPDSICGPVRLPTCLSACLF